MLAAGLLHSSVMQNANSKMQTLRGDSVLPLAHHWHFAFDFCITGYFTASSNLIASSSAAVPSILADPGSSERAA